MTIQQIINRNIRNGGFFFSDNTMKAFKSKIYDKVYHNCLFLESNKAPHSPRKYHINMSDAPGDIVSISKGFNNLNDARAFAETLTAVDVAFFQRLNKMSYKQTVNFIQNIRNAKQSKYQTSLDILLKSINLFDGTCFTWIRAMKRENII